MIPQSDPDDLLWERLRVLCGPAPFMLLDAARDPGILPLLAALEPELDMTCLWQGDAAEELADVAPYLVALGPAQVSARLLRAAWGRAWGILLTAGVGFLPLRRQLRRLGLARLPDGEAVYFRFYDPRVLRRFLPICAPDQLAALFEGVDAFLAESEDAGEILQFRRDAAGRLATLSVPLSGSR